MLASAIATGIGGSAWSLAHAQDAASAADQQPFEEIVVTGTRIRRDDYSSPNATATITGEDMLNLGVTSVAEMITQMPSNVGTFQPDTTADGAFFVGSTLANLRGLNSFFSTRTLTLVDNRRFVSTNNGGGVDLNFIPSVLVGRLETVTGGASASYGSDAIAGVVNVILDRNLEGVRLDVGYSAYDAGDGDNYNIGIAGGTEVLRGRGHVTVGFERQNQDAIWDCAAARDWCARSMGTISQGSGDGPLTPLNNPYFAGQGLPHRIITEDLRFNVSRNGTIHTSNDLETDPTNGTFYEFTPDGKDIRVWNAALADSPYPGLAYRNVSATVIGGEGRRTTEGITLMPENNRDNVYLRFNYDISDRIALNTEVSYGQTEAMNLQNSARLSNSTFCLSGDNAFIAQGSALMQEVLGYRMATPDFFDFFDTCRNWAPAPGTIGELLGPSATITKDWSGQINRTVETDTEVSRVLVGANGELFESGNWTWDAYFQYGKTERSQIATNNLTQNRYRMALDAIVDPITGEVVCRVNASDGFNNRAAWEQFFGRGDAAVGKEYVDVLAPGCVPLNPFGTAASADALEYVFDDLIEFTDIEQKVLSASFSGDAWKGIGSGALRMAAGMDLRDDRTLNDAGDRPMILRQDFGAQYGDPWAGKVEAAEVFAEFELPLLRDKLAADYLMVNVAGRKGRTWTSRLDGVDDDKYERDTESTKTSLVWSPTSWARVRATRSLDVRGPAPRELYYRQTQPPGGFGSLISNPWREDDPNTFQDERFDDVQTIIGANPDLRNEESVTETYGVVFTPGGWAEGLQISADYYKLEVQGGITYPAGSFTLDQCFIYEDPFYCDRITFGDPTPDGNARGDIISIENTQENAQPYYSRGIDFSVSYFKPLSRGALSLRVLATRTLEQTVCRASSRLEGDTRPTCTLFRNVVGQTGGNVDFLANYSPTPELAGNAFATYSINAMSFTTQVRYTGPGKLNSTTPWYGPDSPEYAPELQDTITYNKLPSWSTWNFSFNYDFGRSQFAPSRLESLTAFLNVDNVFDEQPDFYSGGGVGGVNTMFFNGLGRSYRVGVRMQF